MVVFIPKLLASAVTSTAACTWATAHMLVFGVTGSDVLLGAGGGSALLYLAYKVFQDETIAKRERRLHDEEMRVARHEAWEKGRRGEPLEEVD